MKKFTKFDSKKQTSKSDKVLFKNDYMSVIDYEDWTIVKEKDAVVCIIYLIDSNQMIIRQEYVPTYKYTDGQEMHITLLSGTMEKDETPEDCLLREIQEEAGIVIRDGLKIEFEKPLFVSKGHTNKYHPCIVQLTENDYHEVAAKGDGSVAESRSKTVKVDIKYINSLNVSDVITEYMILKLKQYLNID